MRHFARLILLLGLLGNSHALKWRNALQALQVERGAPLPNSPAMRVMPLGNFAVKYGFGQSLELNWGQQAGACHLQKVETTARQLTRARKISDGLGPFEGRQ